MSKLNSKKDEKELLDAIIDQAAMALAKFSLIYRVAKGIDSEEARNSSIDRETAMKILVKGLGTIGDEISEVLIALQLLAGESPNVAITKMKNHLAKLNEQAEATMPSTPEELRDLIQQKLQEGAPPEQG